MKTKFSKTTGGFSALDLVIVIATVVVLAGVGWQMANRRATARGSRPTCINHLKQIGIGFRLYATDGEPYPNFNATNEVWQYFQIVGPEIGSAKILVCPDDAAKNGRQIAEDFNSPPSQRSLAHPNNQNKALSYFYSTDAAEEHPTTILAGDRNISTNAQILSGMLLVGPTSSVQWTQEPHEGKGNILLADGSAQMMTTATMREAFRINTNLTQRVLIP